MSLNDKSIHNVEYVAHSCCNFLIIDVYEDYNICEDWRRAPRMVSAVYKALYYQLKTSLTH